SASASSATVGRGMGNSCGCDADIVCDRDHSPAFLLLPRERGKGEKPGAAVAVQGYGKLPTTELPPPPTVRETPLSSAAATASTAAAAGAVSPGQSLVARWKNRLSGTRSALSNPPGCDSARVT